MSTTITTPPMGGISPPAPPRMTPEEFAERYDGQRVEYHDGQVVEMPMPYPNHGTICNWISFYVTTAAVMADSGRGVSNDSWMKMPTPEDPTKVVGPDMAYFSYERLPKGRVPHGFLPVDPEIAFEVRSPSDHWPKIRKKAAAYLENDVLAVVVFDPAKDTATVFTEAGESKLTTNDMLDLSNILPGFRVLVAKFFA